MSYYESDEEKKHDYANYMASVVFQTTGDRMKAQNARERVMSGEWPVPENYSPETHYLD